MISDKEKIQEIFNNLNIEEKQMLKKMIEEQTNEEIREARLDEIIKTILNIWPPNSRNHIPTIIEEIMIIIKECLRKKQCYIQYDVYDEIVFGSRVITRNGDFKNSMPCVKIVEEEYGGFMDMITFFTHDIGLKTCLKGLEDEDYDNMLRDIEDVLKKEVYEV